MSGGSREQVTRLLALAPYLQTRGEVPLKEVAADFGVTPAQMLKDLRVLFMCGLPGYGPGDLIDINVEALEDDPDGLVRVDNADFLARPLRLGSNEASALIVALHALLDASPAGSREVVERTLAKLEDAATAGSTPLVDVHLPRSGPSVDGTWGALAGAIEADRQARLDYYVPTRDETTQRVVDPIAVIRSQGRSYLDAWCHLADDRRLFRLDRITALEILDSHRVSHDLEPRDLSEGLFEPGDPKIEIRRLLGEGDWVVAETTGRGTLLNGNHYENQYVFVLRVDGDKVLFLREYMDSAYAHSISAGSGGAGGADGHVSDTLKALGHD